MFFKLSKLSTIYCILFFGLTQHINSQDSTAITQDTVELESISDTNRIDIDSLSVFNPSNDSLISDSIVPIRRQRGTPIQSVVKYSADDSLVISLKDEKIFLYTKSKVDYQDNALSAGRIEFGMTDNIVKASGYKDTSNVMVENPVFKQGENNFEADTIRYNFETKKGNIKNVVTPQGDGILRGKTIKRHNNEHIHIRNGQYTTCDADHPHYYIALTKAIAIPEDKIISGRAYLVIEDIPTPLQLPFGFFPNSSKRTKGILIPSYGEEARRGFFLADGGFYWPINDYMDIIFKGSYYSRGSWGANLESNYMKRYKFQGDIRLNYELYEIKDDPSAETTKSYRFYWKHTQLPKAHPTRTFSANVDFSSTKYDDLHNLNVSEKLQNTKTSSISYQKRWPGNPSFNLTSNINHSQNNQTEIVNISAPDIAFSMSDIYPFKSKNSTGKSKWYEKIRTNYQLKIKNRINTHDTILFTDDMYKDMKNGVEHIIPITFGNINILNLISITPNTTYQGNLYFSQIRAKRIQTDTVIFSNDYNETIDLDTVPGIFYAHGFTAPSLNINISRNIYGFFTVDTTKMPNFFLYQIRHLLKPSVSFGIRPDMTEIMPSYRRRISTANSITQHNSYYEYSMYGNSLFSPYEPAKGSISAINISLNNNFEMKVRSRNDSTSNFKKVALLENLNFSTSYNPTADSLRWSNIRMTGATNLFNRKMKITFNGNFDPYEIDENGNRINVYRISNGKFPRLTNLNYSVSLNLKSNQKKKSSENDEASPAFRSNIPIVDEGGSIIPEEELYMLDNIIDFSVPWDLSINYNWTMKNYRNKKKYTHNIRARGNIELTKNWKIGGSTGYDFIGKEFTTTSLNIARKLHCWTMTMSLTPFGKYKSYYFTLRAKATLLQDLKIDKRKSIYDY